MGLDMFLEKRTYVGGNYDHKITGSIDLARDGVPIPIQLSRVTTISEEVGYWRKANHIHKWFVDKVQEGEDNCASYWVSIDQLKELRALCKLILSAKRGSEEQNSLIEKQLPPAEGFFFGSTAVDDYYFQDCEETVTIIDKAIEEEGEYYYQSSW